MGLEADTRAIEGLAARLDELLTWDDHRLFACVPAVSSWSVAQQLEHVVRASTRMLDMLALLASGNAHDRVKDRGSPSVTGRAILLAGRIPRGRAEAPGETLPDAVPSRAALREATETLTRRLRARAADPTDLRDIKGVGEHPLLGWFSAPQWWRFLRVHAEHHLAVIDDIDGHRVSTEPIPRPAPS